MAAARKGNVELVKRTGSQQFICTECGQPFMSADGGAKTCSNKCRQRRYRRFKQNPEAPEFDIDAGERQEQMQNATAQALDDLPHVAREVLAEELRPAVREALTGRVLESIGDMVGLLPLVQDALRDDLSAKLPILDGDGLPIRDTDGSIVYLVDYERRTKAQQLVLKYTVGQPGLAPQPEAPEQAPIQIVFPTMPAPPSHIDGTAAPEELPEVAEGQRICDICQGAKDASEFVGESSRCQLCHAAARERIEAAIAERTKGAATP